MRKLICKISFAIIITLASRTAQGQGMSINTTGLSADASAMLDVSSTTRGLLVPRMTTTQRTGISFPAKGLLVYDNTLDSFFFNSGSPGTPSWSVLGANLFPSGSDGQVLQMVSGVPTWVGTALTIGSSYGGGVVAYILQPGDDGYSPVVQHGLIAATSDLGTAPWGNFIFSTTNAIGVTINTGKSNTNLILITQVGGGYAASLCYNYTGGGYTDWYLPSLYELNALYLNQVAIGGFTSGGFYWSSSEQSIYLAWWIKFGIGGYWGNGSKNGYLNVRAVRKF